MPLIPVENHAEMRNGNVFAIDFVGVGRRVKRTTGRIDMGHQLMSKEIEVDPFAIGSPFGAAEKGAIELSGGRQIVYGNRQMKRCRHGSSSGFFSSFEKSREEDLEILGHQTL